MKEVDGEGGKKGRGGGGEKRAPAFKKTNVLWWKGTRREKEGKEEGGTGL